MSAAQRNRAKRMTLITQKQSSYTENDENVTAVPVSPTKQLITSSTVNQSCEDQGKETFPLLTIPISEKELDLAIQTISSGHSENQKFAIPDKFIVDCTNDNSHQNLTFLENTSYVNEVMTTPIIFTNSSGHVNEQLIYQEMHTKSNHNIKYRNIELSAIIHNKDEQQINNNTEQSEYFQGIGDLEKEVALILASNGNNEDDQLISNEGERLVSNEDRQLVNNEGEQLVSNKGEQLDFDQIIAEHSMGVSEIPQANTENVEDELLSNNLKDPDYIPIIEATTSVTCQRPKRGRKRKNADQNRNIRKQRANTNQSYVSAKGKIIDSRPFAGTDYSCGCPKKCTEMVTVAEREAEFCKFWAAGSYEARCALIQGYVCEKDKKRSYSATSKRMYTRKYFMNNKEICKKTFLNTLSISQIRIDNALKKKRNNERINDKRGQISGGKNVISEEKLNLLRNFFQGLPRYVSHYCRDNVSANYLAPQLNLPILYDVYKENHTTASVSFSRFRKCFIEDFNLKFKKPQKDTCLRCDSFKAQVPAANPVEKIQLEQEHSNHLDHAQSLRIQMKTDLQKAKDDIYTETLTFDLEKTHSLPKLPTSVVYYKRQLNLYNLGIHSGTTGQGYFYIWLEHEAGRGTQEVGSCLRKHIIEKLKPNVIHLILWSDSCGGQNRSIKMVLMLLHILRNHPSLEKITLRFLQPGHTYLPNDSEFGDVECALKTNCRLYTDEDFISVMKSCRRKNKCNVTKLTKDDFLSIDPMQKLITNRKRDINKLKISWLNTFEIELNKNEPTQLLMKMKLTDEPKIVDISKGTKKQRKEVNFNIELPVLHPDGRELSAEK